MSSIVFNELEIARCLCKDSYYFFVKEFWDVVAMGAKFVDNWHIKYVCRELQYLVEWFIEGTKPNHDDKYNYKPYDLVINMSPGSTKSLLCSVFLQPWVWTKYPYASFIESSFQENLSVDLSRKSRMLIKSEKYKTYFPEVEISDDQDAKGKFANTFQGERNSVGNKGGITGRHADFIIVDDPIDPKGSRSIIEMEQANQFIRETLWSRKKDKARTPTVLVMQRLHQCLIPGTPVQTSKGRKPIESLLVGDKVISRTGISKVLAIGSRKHNGEIIHLNVYGHPDTISMTPEHPVLTQRGWVESGKLKTTDFIFGSPKEFKRTSVFYWPDVRYAEPPKKPTGNYIYGLTHSSLDERTIRQYAQEGLTNCEIAKKLGVHRNTVHNAMLEYQIKRVKNRSPIFDANILNEPEFWFAVGLWVAEGTLTKGRRIPSGVRFSLHKKETYFVERMANFFFKYGVDVTVRDVVNNTMQVFIWCSQFATFLKRYFRTGAHKKRIPIALYGISEKCRSSFLEGWMKGDGSYNKSKKQFRGTSVSHSLTDGISMLLGTLGVSNTIIKENNKPKKLFLSGYWIETSGKTREVRFCSCDTPWMGVNDKRSFERLNHRKIIVDSIGLWRKIKKIEKEAYNGLVYDIKTTDHSFIAGGCCVHNSDPSAMFLDMAARGEAKIKHICFPAVLTDDVKPVECREYYKDGLFDPVRLPVKVLDEARAQGEYSWAGQFLQRPVPIGGGMFKVDKIKIKESWELPDKRLFIKKVRYWDKAATEGSGCFTVGFLMGKDRDQRFWILDIVRGRWDTATRERIIQETALKDGQDVVIGVEQEPGSGGKDSALTTVRNLIGWRVVVQKATGAKELRADPFSAQVNGENVYMLRAPWNSALLDEMALFPNSTYLDQVDSGAGAFNLLTQNVKRVGGW